MREPDHALGLIEAVVAAVAVPVTLKMRLGWDHDRINAPEIAARAEAAGIRMVTVHGRTRAQFYKGQADWAAIRAVRAATRLPLVANGDIRSAEDARQALALSGADGVMIGRGSVGAPWRLAQVAAGLAGRSAPDVPNGQARAELIAAHCAAQAEFYGADVGLRAFRKHLDAYLADIPGAKPLRDRLIRETSADRVIRALVTELAALEPPPERRAA